MKRPEKLYWKDRTLLYWKDQTCYIEKTGSFITGDGTSHSINQDVLDSEIFIKYLLINSKGKAHWRRWYRKRWKEVENPEEGEENEGDEGEEGEEEGANED